MNNYIVKSVKNVLGEDSIGWREVEKNQKILSELKTVLEPVDKKYCPICGCCINTNTVSKHKQDCVIGKALKLIG